MKYFKKLAGERVYLSPMNVADLELYTKWMNDYAVTSGLGNAARMISLAGEKDFIEKSCREQQLAIVALEGDRLLGNAGFENIDPLSQCAEVGLFIGEEADRGKGYGAEALGLLLDYGFQTLNLRNIMLRAFSFNERAIACYKKAGFREFGRRRECVYVGGRFHDSVHMDILKEEWLARKH